MDAYLKTTTKLQADTVSRASETAQKAAKLAVMRQLADSFVDCGELIEATYKRTHALQVSWVKDWSNWVGYAKSIEGANTVPKYVDRTGNIFLQAQAQLTSQASEMSELMDNIGVSYAYWLNRQLAKHQDD